MVYFLGAIMFHFQLMLLTITKFSRLLLCASLVAVYDRIMPLLIYPCMVGVVLIMALWWYNRRT